MLLSEPTKVRVQNYFKEIGAPWYALPIAVICIASMYFISIKITLSPFESVKPSLLWKVERKPHMGDYVTFPFSHPLITTKAEAWIKLLACTEGHLLQRIDNKFYCDGQFFANARLKSKANQDLPQFHYNGLIPENKAFVLGDGTNSFDSRHFGFVDYNTMTTNIELLPGPFKSSPGKLEVGEAR